MTETKYLALYDAIRVDEVSIIRENGKTFTFRRSYIHAGVSFAYRATLKKAGRNHALFESLDAAWFSIIDFLNHRLIVQLESLKTTELQIKRAEDLRLSSTQEIA